MATWPQPQHFRARKWWFWGFYFCSHFLSSGRNILFDMKIIQHYKRIWFKTGKIWNTKVICYFSAQTLLMNQNETSKMFNLSKFLGCFVFAPIRGLILVDKQRLSWKIAYNLGISDFAFYIDRIFSKTAWISEVQSKSHLNI